MTRNINSYSRRAFIRRLTAMSALAAGTFPSVLTSAANTIPLHPKSRPASSGDNIRFATIGMGIIGFIDTDTALKAPGSQFVAAADLYIGRLERTKEIFGNDVFTTRDYREVLARSDVDAIIVATSDHWHARIAIDAMKAGKDVYCEKPMVHDIEEGPLMLNVQKETKQVLQVGSQMVSSITYEKARELIKAGAIGELNMVRARNNRNSAIGAWQYSIPPDASKETVDWQTFLGDAPKRPFDPVRFFRWRNYWDYGTGIPGDLYVHLFSGIHFVLASNGPTRIMSTGGLRYWKDGRDVPDVIQGLYDYPETAGHPAFSLVLETNLANGGEGGSGFQFIGNEGMISIGWDGMKVSRRAPHRASEEELVKGYNSVRTFSEATQKEFLKQYRASAAGQHERAHLDGTTQYKEPEGYDARVDHFANFFQAVRTRKPVVENTAFGFRAAAPSLITNLSYLNNRIYHWDPERMKISS